MPAARPRVVALSSGSNRQAHEERSEDRKLKPPKSKPQPVVVLHITAVSERVPDSEDIDRGDDIAVQHPPSLNAEPRGQHCLDSKRAPV
jgi:hypothetical protein